MGCTANSCAATEVANSDKAGTGAINGDTGDTIIVTCETGYAGTSTFTATCGTSGSFNAITCAAQTCSSANVANSDKASAGDISGNTGTTVTVECIPGYTGAGAGFPTATCGTDGNFNTLTCTANSCAATEVANSNKAATGAINGDTGDTITVTCETGYAGTSTFTATCGTS